MTDGNFNFANYARRVSALVSPDAQNEPDEETLSPEAAPATAESTEAVPDDAGGRGDEDGASSCQSDLLPREAAADPLQVAPLAFAAAHRAGNAAAVLFEYIRSRGLYKAADFRQMREYARARLGLKSNGAYKDYARAGVAAWKFYPAESAAVLNLLLEGGWTFNPPLQAPRLPGLSVLRELQRALKKADPAGHQNLLVKAASGEVTLEHLRAMQAPPTSVAEARDDRQPSPAINVEATALSADSDTRENAPANGPDGLHLDVFHEVADIAKAAALLRAGTALLATVARACSDARDHEVDELALNLSPAVVFLEHLVKTLENDLTPASVCSHCQGDGCTKCRQAGWQPTVPRKTPLRLEGKLAFTRQKVPAKTRVQVGTTLKASKAKGATKRRK